MRSGRQAPLSRAVNEIAVTPRGRRRRPENLRTLDRQRYWWEGLTDSGMAEKRAASGALRRVAARSPLTVPPTDHATVGAGITARLHQIKSCHGSALQDLASEP
jgi:hypothetical protein